MNKQIVLIASVLADQNQSVARGYGATTNSADSMNLYLIKTRAGPGAMDQQPFATSVIDFDSYF